MENPFEAILKELQDIKAMMISDNPANHAYQEEYLKVDRAAEFLSTSENALRAMCLKLQIKHIKKQGRLYFRKSDLIDWLESGAVSIATREDDDDILLPRKRKARRRSDQGEHE